MPSRSIFLSSLLVKETTADENNQARFTERNKTFAFFPPETFNLKFKLKILSQQQLLIHS